MKKRIRRFFILLLIVLLIAGYLSWKSRKNADNALLETISGELSDGETSATARLKVFLEKSSHMTDEELKQEIRRLARARKVRLTDTQVQQLADLCRMLEKLNPQELREKVEKLQKLLKRAGDAKDKLEELIGLVEALTGFGEKNSEAADSPTGGQIEANNDAGMLDALIRLLTGA